MELFERHLGLVGLGRIGGRLARMAGGIGMKVMAFDPYVDRSRAGQLGIQLADTLDQLLAWADVLSLHVPLTDATREMINAGALAKMKRGSILINCARGDLVDEGALLEALMNGHLAGAGLDVFQREPLPHDHPLLIHDNVIATPHVASATVAGKRRLWKMAIDQAIGVCRGERPPHLVNPDAWPSRTSESADEGPQQR
jgi:phosphoglycerate dehydrogenase-like enzyme